MSALRVLSASVCGVQDSLVIPSRAPAGLQACQLALSARTVWARCPNGDVARRYGVTDKNPAGDYWKKIPGNVSRLTGKLVLHGSLSKALGCLL